MIKAGGNYDLTFSPEPWPGFGKNETAFRIANFAIELWHRHSTLLNDLCY